MTICDVPTIALFAPEPRLALNVNPQTDLHADKGRAMPLTGLRAMANGQCHYHPKEGGFLAVLAEHLFAMA